MFTKTSFINHHNNTHNIFKNARAKGKLFRTVTIFYLKKKKKKTVWIMHLAGPGWVSLHSEWVEAGPEYRIKPSAPSKRGEQSKQLLTGTRQ